MLPTATANATLDTRDGCKVLVLSVVQENGQMAPKFPASNVYLANIPNRLVQATRLSVLIARLCQGIYLGLSPMLMSTVVTALLVGLV